MKQFFSLLDGMMEYRQLKEAIEQGRVPVSLTGAAAAHKTTSSPRWSTSCSARRW